MRSKTAIIIGAGPAGLTAAFELVHRTDVKPVIFEMSGDIGGISKTIVYKGNRIDIGGHRFFSKSKQVMEWWQNILPVQGYPASDDKKLARQVELSKKPGAPDPDKTDKVMLVRKRLSRIYFLRKFFDYPISINFKTFANLGLQRVFAIGLSYVKARFYPIKNEKTLEDLLINRFGKALYLTFFKEYTRKVWGVPPGQINPEWGSQRIKGLSITKAIWHALKQLAFRDRSLAQKQTETSLIEQFYYPKYGPGQMWEAVAAIIKQKGGELHLNQEAVGFELGGNRIASARIKNGATGTIQNVEGDYFISTMAVKDLIEALGDRVPMEISEIASGLIYRSFITVGLLLKKLKIKNRTKIKTLNGIIPDNWIYIQETDVRVGRVKVFNNWSTYMVKEEKTVWMGLEYFCDEDDELWHKTDEWLIDFAIGEMEKIDIIGRASVLDGVVIRMPKTYPAYFGSYSRFPKLRQFTDSIQNLFLIGRNGMHRYNNQDHSMLTAMLAVENILNDVKTKDNIWDVNIEKEYHEEK